MAGHSKWKQIQHKKALTDARRGRLFSKLAREVTVAAKTGGSNPDANPRLASAMERAKNFGLPKENIERAVSRASGKETENLTEFMYEVIGPGGIYILIEGITDNNNRTLAEVKQTLARHEAKLVPPNSLLWNFEKVWTDEGKDYKPQTTIEVAEDIREKLTRLLDELTEHDDVQEVYTNSNL